MVSDIRELNEVLMKFCVLASGSSGNACYVETDNARVLIDAGLSGREIERRLELAGGDASELTALIVTHEHSDHIQSAGVLSRRYNIPLYMNEKTFGSGRHALGKNLKIEIIQTGQSLQIDDLEVETFTKCHDAADPVGLVLSLNGVRLGVVTDLGKSTRLVEDRLQRCRALIIEFNHDPEMLDTGSYPLYLKRRIKGRDGHLSNKQGGDLLRKVCHDNLEKVVLAHLSEQNNHPEKAFQQAVEALDRCGMAHQTDIWVSRQDEPGPMFELK